MNIRKVNAEDYQTNKSSLPVLLYSGRRDHAALLYRNRDFLMPWMLCLLVLCMALVTASFMTITAPALAVAPNPRIDISPAEGFVGSKVLVRILEFVPKRTVFVKFSRGLVGSPSIISVNVITDDLGFAAAEFTIDLIPGGVYKISADDGTNIQTGNFIVLPSVTLSQAAGVVGDLVTFWGNGFAAKKPVSIFLDDVKMGTSDTEDSGKFPNTKIIMPPLALGKHDIKIQDSEGNQVTKIYSANPRVIINPVSGCVGDIITISGAGYPALTNSVISLDGTDIATVTTDAFGNVNTTLKIPPIVDGVHKIKVSDGLNSIISEVTVVPAMTASQNAGYVDMNVTLNGTGFRSGNALQATYDKIKLGGSTVEQNGTFTYTFSIPKSKAGQHNINITDGVNNRTASFTVESTPPPTPNIVTPAEGSRLSKDTSFKWENVTDPSGVTYVIEVADDARFSQIVMTRADLVQAYLAVPDSEKALPGKPGAYYWRVKAIDGASNVGNWSVIGTFYKGATVQSVVSDMPVWTKFILTGIGLILFIAMVIFVRKNIMRVRYSAEADASGDSGSEYDTGWERSDRSNKYVN